MEEEKSLLINCFISFKNPHFFYLFKFFYQVRKNHQESSRPGTKPPLNVL